MRTVILISTYLLYLIHLVLAAVIFAKGVETLQDLGDLVWFCFMALVFLIFFTSNKNHE